MDWTRHLIFIFFLGIIIYAQVDRTAITGTVTDQQGKVIPRCRVRAIDTATGFQRETVTTSQGAYELLGLPPGVYSIRFVADGFEVFAAANVRQSVGQTR